MSTQTAAEAWAEYQAAKQSTPASKPKRKRCGACAAVHDSDRCPVCHPPEAPAKAVAPTQPAEKPRRECAACGQLYTPPPRPPGMSGYPPRRCPECVESGRRSSGKARHQKLTAIAAPAPAPEPMDGSAPVLAMEPKTDSAPPGSDPVSAILQAVANVRPGITVRFVYVEMSDA